jgi:hypothetical protein
MEFIVLRVNRCTVQKQTTNMAYRLALSILCVASGEAFLQQPSRVQLKGTAARKLPALGFGFFGGGKSSPALEPGLVRKIDFDTCGRPQTHT